MPTTTSQTTKSTDASAATLSAAYSIASAAGTALPATTNTNSGNSELHTTGTLILLVRIITIKIRLHHKIATPTYSY